MKKRVFIIHGWGGSPKGNWFQSVKNSLEEADFEVMVPQMPNAEFPKQEEWVTYMQKVIGDANENTFLIGHSLGAIAILHFIESLSANKKIGGAILVSGFSESLGTISEIENFFTNTVDYEKIESHCDNFVAINSDNDPYVPIEKGKNLRDNLGAKFITLHNAGHIMASDGYLDLPIVVEELLRISK